MAVERYYDDVKVGDEGVSPTFTVSEAHIMTYADLTGDHTPVYVDEAYAKTIPFGTRVAHGLMRVSSKRPNWGVLYAEGAVSRLRNVHGTKSSRGKVV